jgi:hypothetical protein
VLSLSLSPPLRRSTFKARRPPRENGQNQPSKTAKTALRQKPRPGHTTCMPEPRPTKRDTQGRFVPGTAPGPGRPKKLKTVAEASDAIDNPHPIFSSKWVAWELAKANIGVRPASCLPGANDPQDQTP